jgi:hypothetical protein
LIGLAPYFFPVVTLAVAFARPALGAGWFPWYDVLIGLSLASHSWSVIANTKGNWHKRRVSPGVAGIRMMSDIGRSGYIFAGIMILSLTLLFFGAIFYVLAAGYRGMATCMYEIVTQSVGVYCPTDHSFLWTILIPMRPVSRAYFFDSGYILYSRCYGFYL